MDQTRRFKRRVFVCKCVQKENRLKESACCVWFLFYPIWVTFRLLSTLTVMLTGC